MMGPGASGGGKDLGGFLGKFAGSLGSQMSGLNMAGNPLSGIGMLRGLTGDRDEEDNPGKKMFGAATNDNMGFLDRFKEQLFKNATAGFMGRGP